MTMEILLIDVVALLTVILIDLLLAGDNAVVIGMAAGRLDPRLRPRAIAIGIILAIVFRITFAVFAVSLLEVVGLLLVGGVLLLWVAWKLWRDIGHNLQMQAQAAEVGLQTVAAAGFWGAIGQIAIADISMSLDNVLAVAGTARHNIAIMVIGLVLSIALMGTMATVIARLLDRYHWLNYAGLALVAIVAVTMIYEGAGDVAEALQSAAVQ